MLPPTISTAPTSEIVRPKPASTVGEPLGREGERDANDEGRGRIKSNGDCGHQQYEEQVCVPNERQLLTAETTEQRAKLAALDRQAAEKAAERATARAMIDKIAAEIPLQQQRVDMRKQLLDSGNGSKILYLQDAQDLVANQKELLVQQSHMNEAEAALQALVEQRAQAVSEYRHSLAEDLVKADAKAAGLTQDVTKAARKTGLQRLTAPVDGTPCSSWPSIP
jgi:hypothetical protein